MIGFIVAALLFGIPSVAVVLFINSLILYISGKRDGRSEQEMRKRKLFLILSAVAAFVLVAALIGIIVMLLIGIAYM